MFASSNGPLVSIVPEIGLRSMPMALRHALGSPHGDVSVPPVAPQDISVGVSVAVPPPVVKVAAVNSDVNVYSQVTTVALAAEDKSDERRVGERGDSTDKT